MPTCKKCGENVPTRIQVNGKFIRRPKRKHCYSCLPFKEKSKLPGDCICRVCNREYKYTRGNGTRIKCGSCYANEKRYEKKKIAVDYKGGKCLICGYNRCIQALDFHHIDPSKKEFDISGRHCLSWDRLVPELDKCVVLCRVCHTELEYGLISLPEKIEYKSIPIDESLFKKNRITENTCECGKKICKVSKKCKSCSSKEQVQKRDKPIPQKEDLQNLIWTEPITKIAKRYQLSDSAIIKWCKKYNIERPGRGYWSTHDYNPEN